MNSSAWPSGHPGGVSHLSTSRCCSTKLFPSKLSTGRHQQRRQMLLHKPAVSQCGLYKIKQAALSTWYGDLLLWHTVKKTALALGLVCLRSICQCVCGCLCATLFDFSTLWPHVPQRIASLAAKPKPSKPASRSGIMVELKCPTPKMSLYVIWKTKLTRTQTWRGWYELQKMQWKKTSF